MNLNGTYMSSGIVTQSNSPDDLSLLSWGQQTEPPRDMADYPYRFNSTFTEDTYVYVIDKGVNTYHEVIWTSSIKIPRLT